MLRLLREPRWLGYLALALVFAVVCCLLGMWQWDRRETALTAIDRLESNYDRDAAPLEAVLPEPSAFDPDQQWTPVELEGEYVTDAQLLLRGRWRGGDVGFDVVVPFRTTTGAVFVVDRGWIDQASGAEQPVTEPATPVGPTTVVARLRPNEGQIAGRGAPEGQIASVDLPSIADSLARRGVADTTYTGAYGLLVSEGGAAPADVAIASRPVLDEGPHLSYTLQWFVFALGGFAAVAWGMREELRSASPVERPQRVRRTDSDIEDDILDLR
ncbi:SURF1 family cytochrome oxidase biogenesis protein [Agrococcus sp. Marseille-P2731]|uniref:SURF1 family cytochrome oxidase biogenesis protein n=1 Tax=Agrococcus sp. Marseille-P2731 TaxID=1841862 RepID=UPI000931F466|nr:SURF1 family protein [Agrococcus sp. Marseille-P2731]